MTTIQINQVASVYSGQAGKCCCGCSGNHRYATAHRIWAAIHRGYEIDDDEVSDRSVKIVVGKITRAEKIKVDGDVISAEVNGRVYIVYLVH